MTLGDLTLSTCCTWRSNLVYFVVCCSIVTRYVLWKSNLNVWSVRFSDSHVLNISLVFTGLRSLLWRGIIFKTKLTNTSIYVVLFQHWFKLTWNLNYLGIIHILVSFCPLYLKNTIVIFKQLTLNKKKPSKILNVDWKG